MLLGMHMGFRRETCNVWSRVLDRIENNFRLELTIFLDAVPSET
jgi:hypothetical protein